MILFEIRNFDHIVYNLNLNHMYYSSQYRAQQYLKQHRILIEVVSISHLEDFQHHMKFNICIDNN